MEIFVGNLPFDITEQEIREKFSECGAVSNVKMLTDKFSGRFRGVAFVTMDDDAQAQNAIASLNGADLGGRPMMVDKRRPRSGRFGGFGGGFSPRPKAKFSRPDAEGESDEASNRGKFFKKSPKFRKYGGDDKYGGGDYRSRRNFRRQRDGYDSRGGSDYRPGQAYSEGDD